MLQLLEKFTVLRKLPECLPDGGDTVGWGAFCDSKGPSNIESGKQKLIKAPVILVFDIFNGRRDCRQIRVSFQCKLYDDVDQGNRVKKRVTRG